MSKRIESENTTGAFDTPPKTNSGGKVHYPRVMKKPRLGTSKMPIDLTTDTQPWPEIPSMDSMDDDEVKSASEDAQSECSEDVTTTIVSCAECGTAIKVKVSVSMNDN